MRYLFIHQAIPGQFPHLARSLAADPKNTVWFLTRVGNAAIPNVHVIRYRIGAKPKPTHPHLFNLRNGVATVIEVAPGAVQGEWTVVNAAGLQAGDSVTAQLTSSIGEGNGDGFGPPGGGPSGG